MSVNKSTKNEILNDIDDEIIGHFIDEFQNAANLSKIYGFDGQSSVHELNLSVHDVISEVTIATRALQKADKVDNKRKPNITSQKSEFVPISFLQPSPKVPKQTTASKFETQFFSNTQLIDVVENAEVIYENSKGISQEFDVDFVPATQCSVYSQVIEDSRSQSPVLSSDKSSHNSTPRLVFNLDVFEKFENVINNKDKFNVDEAKVLIHSQILNNELEFHGDCSNNVDKYDSAHHLVQEFVKKDVNKQKDDSTTGSFLDDEILFSSDEEDYVHKDLKDLPATCDLNTSTSDNESEILDKTLYVGFITANNRPIQITSESYCKANNIFNETVSEVEINLFDKNADLENCKDDNISMSPVLNTTEQTLKINRELHYSKKEIANNTQPKTISNKIIKTSNKPLTRADVIFKMLKNKTVDGSKPKDNDILKTSPAKRKLSTTESHQIKIEESYTKNENELEDDLFADDISFKDLGCTQDYKVLSTLNDFKTNNNEHISDEVLAKTKHWFNNIDIANNSEKSNKNVVIAPNFEKFGPSNKKINVSDKALAKTEHLLQNIEENKEIFNDNVDIEMTDAYSAKSDQIFDDVDDISIECVENLKNNNSKMEEIVMTDSKNISISNKALTNTEKNVDTIDGLKINEMKESKIHKNYMNIGFKLASNKNDQISEKALVVSKHIFQGIDGDDVEPTHSDKDFVGFKTASNKNVQISDKALAMSKHIFQAIDGDDVEPSHSDKDFVGFKTASNKNVQISDKALAMSKHIFQAIDGDDVEPTHSVKDFVEFKTASNKNVQISDKALAMSKHIFQGIDGDDEKPTHSKKEFVGFKTASNKNVQISEKALVMSKHIFQGIDGDDVEPTHSEKDFVGFKTASNKNVQISDKALAMSKHIFQAIDGDDVEPTHSDKDFVGFKTASNKNVQISEKALVMSKHIFQGINTDDEKPTYSEKEIVGFKTASNKNDQISKEALFTSNCLFKDTDVVEYNTKHRSDIVVGFKTASNNDVQISEEALSKTKHFFKNIDIDEQELGDDYHDKDQTKNNDQIFGDTLDMVDDDAINIDLKDCKKDISTISGFFTANNKIIKVSDESLVKTKNLFKEIDMNIIPKFEGFKTCNNDTIKVSDSAIAKSKNLLNLPNLSKDLTHLDNNREIQLESKLNDIGDEIEMSQILKGFSTGNDKSVTVSEEAILKTKNLFNKPYESKTESKAKVDHRNAIISDLLDSQLTKDFEHNLCTDDFYKESQNLKRPSPILHYSKAKRMKLSSTDNEKTPEITAKFDENYKKHKLMTLKDLNDDNNTKTLDLFILKYDFDNILDIEFEEKRNNLTENKLTIVNVIDIFKESVNKNIIPEGWIENHIKLILWKLVSYEIKFPNKMKGVCNVMELMNQLKYRYDRELYNVERPPLRKILEKDESPAKPMILCVVKIYANNISVSGIPNKTDTIELELTDGWYCLRAVIDRVLSNLVHQGKIVVGAKIITQGAELVNCEHGLSPWEDTFNVRLKLSANSTRRVRWHSKLGFYHRGGMSTCLPHVIVGGGRAPKVRVFVSRVYPLLYVERLEDGSTVTRTERQEEMHQMKYESDRQLRIEKLLEELTKEEPEADSQYTGPVGDLNTGSQIVRAMRMARDPYSFRATLTESQLTALHDYQTKKRDSIAEDLRKEINERLKECDPQRSTVSLLKMRVHGYYMRNVSLKSCGALLSVWRTGQEVLERVSEGAWVDLYNVVPTGMRNSELQLSAGRQTMIDVCKTGEKKFAGFAKQLRRRPTKIADLVAQHNMNSPYNEFDIAGLIFHIEPTTEDFETQGNKTNFQNVFLTDSDMKFICVNFWGGIRKTGFEKLLAVGQFIAGVNLRSRVGNSGKTIPQFRFLETSYFTKSPKYQDLKADLISVVDSFSRIDIEEFCKNCVSLKNQMSLSKYKRKDTSLILNNSFFDSPLPNLDDFDLSAADFESTFKQTQSESPGRLKKSMVNEKIEKLRKMYGEPPPLSPICIKNRGTNVTKSYKSPFSIINESSVANIKNQRVIEETSPVLKKRSTKRVFTGNPVKLDFCQNENSLRQDSNSPPMSLD